MQNIEEIYKEYFETVHKYLFCLTRNNDISEELTQETFYRAVKKIDTFKGDCKISVWLCQIAKNLWYDELRKNKKFSCNCNFICNSCREKGNNTYKSTTQSTRNKERYSI